MDVFSRTELLLGQAGMERLKKARVAVFGLGGVGGYAAEALARSGVGALDLVDNDSVSETNINRQIVALLSTVGKRKTEAAAAQSETAAKREGAYKPRVPGSVAFVPSVAGLIAAGEAVKAIAGVYGNGIDRS